MPKSKPDKSKGKVKEEEEDPLAEFGIGEGEEEEKEEEEEKPKKGKKKDEEEEPEDPENEEGGDIDTAISSDGIKKSVAKSGGGGGHFLYFAQDGDRHEVRFLDDLMKGKYVPRHESWPGLRATTCLKVYDEKCKYCKSGVPTRDWYAWNVIVFKSVVKGAETNFAKKPKVAILAIKAVAGGAVTNLSDYHQENGSLLTTNFVVKQSGDKKERKINAMAVVRTSPEAKSLIKKAIIELKDKRFDLLKALKPSDTPDVGEGGSSGGDDSTGFGDLEDEV